MRSPKIYITAYNCSPGKGSEHSCGWNLIYHISRYVHVTVLTDEQFRSDFDPESPLLKNITMVFIKNPVNLSFLNSLQFPIGFYLTYRYWEKEVYTYLKKKHDQGGVDLIHRVTIGSVKEPGYCWRINVPYIWNEAHVPSHVPYRFFHLFSWKTKIIFFILNLSRFKILYLNRRAKQAFQRAFYIFASNRETQKLFKERFKRECGICYETGSFQKPFPPIRKRLPHEPFQIFWAGRIVDFKGLELVIRAIALLPPDVNYEFVIAGEGNDKERLERLARKLHVKVNFIGQLPYHEVPALFASSHCFVMTSFKDGLTNAVVESLANFCPVICLDHLTFGEVIDEKVGLKVPVTSLEQMITQIAERIHFLYANEDHRIQLLKNMPNLVEGLSWEMNAKRVIAVYERALTVEIPTDGAMPTD